MRKENDSLISELARKTAETPNRTLMQFETGIFTFAWFHVRCDEMVAALTQEYGVSPGDYVGVMCENSVEAASLIFALARVGAIWVPLNTKQRGKSLEHILGDSNPKLIIADSEYLEIIEEHCTSKTTLVCLDTVSEIGGKTLTAEVAREIAEIQIPSAGALLSVMYTSGTTGPPKGVAVTHRMMEFALRGISQLTSLRANDIFFQWEPFYHVGGAQMLFLPLLYDVHTAVVKRFSASQFWSQIAQTRSTHFHYLGGILEILLKSEKPEEYSCENLRIAWGAGCPQSMWETVENRFQVGVRECYGMTEASSITTTNHRGPTGSVGEPLPWASVAIIDSSGQQVPSGESGEIEITEHEPGVLFDRYINNEEATRKARRGNSFLTGDRGRCDAEGFLYFEGRLNDSVRHKGENVSAWEVETTAVEHPDIESVALIGVDADVGEMDLHLYASRVVASELSESQYHDWLKERLARYQVPRYITFVSDFERTPSQRVQKKKLPPMQDHTWDSEQT